MILRDYQNDIAHRGALTLLNHGLLCLFMEVRTGKTITALAVAKGNGYKSVLFLTKKKAVASIEADYKLLNPGYKLHVTNFEQAGKLSPSDYDHIIVDECHSFGAFPKPSQRTLAVRKLCIGKPVTFLSGTPSPESYSQLYHMLSLSQWSPFKQYTNFYKWATHFVNVKKKRIGGGMLINDYSEANGDLIWKNIKQFCIMFTQEQAGFVAKVDEIVLEVEMSDEAKAIYRSLEKDKLYTRQIPISGREINATVNGGGDLINKLAQISSGTLLFDEEQNGVIIDWSKAQFIVSYFIGKKIAIFYRYRAELELLKAFFPKWTDSPETFNANSGLTFLGQIQSVREGVNLSTADALVAYNIDFSATSYFQLKARAQYKDRKGTAPFYWIFSKHGIERKVYQAVINKTNFTYSYYRQHVGKNNSEQNQKRTNQTRLDSIEAGAGQQVGVS